MRAPAFISRMFKPPPETRDASVRDVLAMAYGYRGAGSTAVGPYMAENLATLLACISAVATTIACLPVALYARTARGRTEITDHPVAELLDVPNQWQTWPDFAEMFLASTLLHGNGVAVIEGDAQGRPTALRPAQWPSTAVSMTRSGRLAYDVTFTTFPYGPVNPPQRFLQGDVLHLRDRSDDGLIGRSRISRAPGPVQNAAGLQTFATSMWENGTMPAGTLRHPKTVSDPARKRLKSDLEQFRGVGNARKLLLLEEGLEYSPLGLVPEQAEVLNSRRFSVEEIARLYSVPPPIVGDLTHGTFSNVETLGRQFATFCLAPWCTKLQTVIGRALLPRGMEIEIDLAGLMRGDFAARWQALVQAHQAGLLTANEIRVSEGYPPLDGGDRLRAMPGEPGAGPATPAAPQNAPRPNGQAGDTPSTMH